MQLIGQDVKPPYFSFAQGWPFVTGITLPPPKQVSHLPIYNQLQVTYR